MAILPFGANSPLTQFGAIYSPCVRFAIKTINGKVQHCAADDIMHSPRFAVVSATPQILDRNSSRCQEFDPQLLLQKLRTILFVAVEKGRQVLVLRLFGCGKKFRNDPSHVVEGFRELLEGEFNGAFSTVCFVVEEDTHVEMIKAYFNSTEVTRPPPPAAAAPSKAEG